MMKLDEISKLLKQPGFIGEAIVDNVKPRDYISTGNYLMNCLISADPYKGLPSNKILQLAGDSSTGKTFLSQELVLNAQKNGYDVIYIDTEGAQDAEQLKKRGIDLDRMMIIPHNTVEDLNVDLTNILDKVDPVSDKIMIVLDSLGNLSTRKEVSDTLADSDKADMTRAKQIRKLFRLLSIRSAYKQVPVVIINHTYSSQSFIPMTIVGGGKGQAYGASVTITLTKSKDKGSDGRINGVFIKAKTDNKSRMARENMTVTLYLSYSTGLNTYYGLAELAEAAGLITKEGRKYKYKDTYYKEIPTEIFDELLKGELGEWLKKLFSYGSAVELKCINEDIEEIEG